jgi:predicted 3-demethylubiquinone-9 3-methyltransferase (glyoxalase superfamily)
MQKIKLFLWFETGAREAANYYKSVFNKDDSATNGQMLENTPSGTVEIININILGQEMTLMSAGPFKKFNEAISFVVSCDNQEEVDYYWEKLSADKSAEQCGWCKDKFGVSWQIVPTRLNELMSDPDRTKANNVTQAMLKMKKIVISELEEAYNQN